MSASTSTGTASTPITAKERARTSKRETSPGKASVDFMDWTDADRSNARAADGGGRRTRPRRVPYRGRTGWRRGSLLHGDDVDVPLLHDPVIQLLEGPAG